ncbi:MAG: LacI family transcriptional regulator [Phycisphaerae bacterium]|nr:LacI family transcriptional regulator [Phycisphaerae bacterium]
MKAKHEQLAERLKATILKAEPGTRLPSVRQIARKSRVSHLTVSRAMDLLEDQEFVLRRPALGIFTARPRGKRADDRSLKRRILLLVPDDWDMEIPLLIRKTLTERGFLSVLQRYDMRERPGRWLPRLTYDGIAFVGFCPPEMLPELRKRNVPFVAQGVQFAHTGVDHTCGDERMVGVMAARHLVELGHRRVAMLVNEPRSPDIEERIEGFSIQCRGMGVEPTVFDCAMIWGDDHRRRAKEMIERQFKHGRFPHTGLFAVGDAGAASALQVFYEHHVRVPQEVSVIGCGNSPESAYLCPALTTLAFDLHDRARAFVDILEQRFAGDRSPQIAKMFAPHLIERKSTAPPTNREDKS